MKINRNLLKNEGYSNPSLLIKKSMDAILKMSMAKHLLILL